MLHVRHIVVKILCLYIGNGYGQDIPLLFFTKNFDKCNDNNVITISDIPADFLKPTKDLCVDLFSSSAKSVREIQTGVQHLQRFEVSIAETVQTYFV